MDLIIQTHQKGKISGEDLQLLQTFAKNRPEYYNLIIGKVHTESHGIVDTPTGEERKLVHILGVVFGFHTRKYPTKSKDRYYCERCSETTTLSCHAKIKGYCVRDYCSRCNSHPLERNYETNHYPITIFKHVEFDWVNPLPKTRHNKQQYRAKDGRKVAIYILAYSEHSVLNLYPPMKRSYDVVHRYPHVKYSERGRFKKLSHSMPFQDLDIKTTR